MARNSEEKSPSAEDVDDQLKICGIVMPIAGMGEEYPEDHWRRVRKILQRAIERAGLKPKLVWENAEVDVIQSAILQNLYENDVVVCDLSGLDSNVMLETGLRLSTKKPTVIITDKCIKPPFDIGVVGYIEYQKDLEYNAIEDFLDRLSKKISAVYAAYVNGNYTSFVENFKFETVTPTTVAVSSEDFLRDQLSYLTSAVRRLERGQRNPDTQKNRSRLQELFEVIGTFSKDTAREVERKIDSALRPDFCVFNTLGEYRHKFTVPVSGQVLSVDAAKQIVTNIIKEAEDGDIPF